MNKALLWFVSIFCSSILFAADYEISSSSHTSSIESETFASEHHSETVKILTEDGTDYRKLIPVNSYIQVKNIQGMVTFPDGHSVPIKTENIFELPLPGGVETMTDYKILAVWPDKLEKGCTVKIDYDRGITSLLYIDPWIYSGYVPLRNTRYSISFPDNIPIKYISDDPAIVPTKTQLGGKTTLVFEARDRGQVSVVGDEDDFEDMQQGVEFVPKKCMTDKYSLSTESWQSVAEWFSELSRFATSADETLDPIVKQAQANSKSPEETAEALYRYIQKNYAYTAIEVGMGGFKPRFAKQTFTNKYGDCKDLAFLYVTLLRKAGIEAYPALISTRSVKLFQPNFPNPKQFNHCIAYLPKIRNGTWVDCTVKSFRFGEVPGPDQGKYSLITGGPNELLQVPDDSRNSNVVKVSMIGTYRDKDIVWNGTMVASGLSAELMEMVKTAVNRNSSRFFVMDHLMAPDVPVQKLEISDEAERSMKLAFQLPVSDAPPYRLALINTMRYPALDYLAVDSKPNQYLSLGMPMRLVLEATLDLAGHHLVSAPVKLEKNGTYLTYKLEVAEIQGKLKYLADAYFANGLLNEKEMQLSQQELRDFASQLPRSIVLQ